MGRGEGWDGMVVLDRIGLYCIGIVWIAAWSSVLIYEGIFRKRSERLSNKFYLEEELFVACASRFTISRA